MLFDTLERINVVLIKEKQHGCIKCRLCWEKKTSEKISLEGTARIGVVPGDKTSKACVSLKQGPFLNKRI